MKKPLLIIACLVAALIVPVTGQEEKPPAFQSLSPQLQLPPLMMAQHMPHDTLSLLQFPGSSGEFKLTGEQRTAMRELNQFRQKASQASMMAMQKAQASGNFSPATYQEYLTAQKAMNAEVDRRLASLLSPKQQERLKQVQIQQVIRNYGFGVLALPELAEVLKLTDKQRDELVNKQIEVQKELRQLVNELRAELEETALNEVLTADQKAKLDSLTGKTFESKVPDYYEQSLRQQLRPSTTKSVLQGVGRAVEQIKKDFEGDKKDKKQKKSP